MKNKINKKITSIIAITLLATICVVSIPSDASALLQVAGTPEFTLYPGESDVYGWGHITNENESGNLITYSEGNGAEFLSFPQSTPINASSAVYIPITISIPEDHPTEPHYNPEGQYYNPVTKSSLSQESESDGGTIITFGVRKTYDITVLPLYCGQPESYYDNIIVGTNSSEYIQGTNGKDLIFGEGGNDLIDGLRASDCIYAGDGNDYIQTGMGSDIIYGGNGDDTIRMSSGVNTVFGEEGNDILYAANKKGSNILDGGNGTDVCALKFENTTASISNCEVTE